jgi:dihydroorotate dehydrogenase
MGFNNAGLDAYLARLRSLPRPLPGIFGANIGINKEGADPERDYPALYEALAPYADYVTVNVSSPNTPGLRDLQGEERLTSILAAINARRAALPKRPPLLVKIAPDLADDALGPIVEACVAQGIAGLIISNTTITRPASLQSPLKDQAGGLSGAPLFTLSTEMLRRCYHLAQGRIALIGVGGIASAEQAYAKIRAGAALVQLYSGFAYAGPVLVRQILDGLAALLARDGFTSVADAVGKDA